MGFSRWQKKKNYPVSILIIFLKNTLESIWINIGLMCNTGSVKSGGGQFFHGEGCSKNVPKYIKKNFSSKFYL